MGHPRSAPQAPATGTDKVDSGEQFSSENARRAKANAELLQEVFRVVFVREPKSPAEFGNWVDTLNQGASLEGVYNGFTHSSTYRELETSKKGAAPSAIQVFAEELALLELELAEPTKFSDKDAQPLVVLGQIDLSTPVTAEERYAPFAKASAEPKKKSDASQLTGQYSKIFLSSSLFTLKRVLGDEALKVIGEKRASKELLATWYSRFVVRIAARGVDFGVPLRNNVFEKFHYDWAIENSEDRLSWEVLNRLHRAVNAANEPK